jgi:hypothetical protein
VVINVARACMTYEIEFFPMAEGKRRFCQLNSRHRGLYSAAIMGKSSNSSIASSTSSIMFVLTSFSALSPVC